MSAFNEIRSSYLGYSRQHQDITTTWANPYQIAHKSVSRLQSDAILFNLRKFQGELNSVKPQLMAAFDVMYDLGTKEEWFATYFLPMEATLKSTIDSITSAIATL